MKNDSIIVHKIVLIVILVSCSVSMVYLFHFHLKTPTIFTHLFYVPIVLAGVWWEIFGIVLAIFLGAVLLSSHMVSVPQWPITEDIVRAAMFVIIGGVIFYLTRQVKAAVKVNIQNERRYKTLFDSIEEAVAIYKVVDDGRDFIFSDINTSVERIEQISKSELIGKSVLDIFPAAKTFGLFDIFQRVWKSGQPEKLPVSFYKDDRISGWRHNEVYKLSEDEIVCVYKDETAKKSADEKIIKLEAIVQNSTDAIVGLTLDGIIQTWNQGAEEIYGYTPEEIVGKHITILHLPERITEFPLLMNKVIKQERVNRYETLRLRKDGKRIHVSLTVSAVKNEFGFIIGASVISRDITRKVKLEAQLQQAQKRQVIGTLAAGIAHDFNNILFPLIGYTEMTLDQLPEESTGYRNLTRVLLAAERAKKLAQHILAFSRESQLERMPLQIHLIVKEVLKLMRASLPTTIRIQQNIKNCGSILADPSQIHQIVMNLCTNAYHAMEENGGVLRIDLSEVEIGEEDYIGMHSGTYVQLTVSDSGHGMEPYLFDKIFDPYFTTKPTGKGTGLGLFVVQSIVKDYGGEIKVYSEMNKGTIFHVYFPKNIHESEDRKTLPASRPLKGNERILVVDDEEQIVIMMKQMLEDLGYRVTGLTSSLEALKLFRAHPGGYDLVITDQTMPNLVGAQLAKRMMEIREDIPVLLCSGFSEDIHGDAVKNIGIRKFVMKPVIKKELVETIREVLNHR